MTFLNCQISVFLRIFGGADRDRTDDLLNAIQALSQLSYGPTTGRILSEQMLSKTRNQSRKVNPQE